MGNEQQNTQQTQQTNGAVTINANTPIQFTIKSYIVTIISILGLFVGFYFMVVVPKLKDTEQYQEKLYNQQKEYISTELDGVKTSIEKNTKAIGINTQAINGTNERFRDLNESIEDLSSSGSFGNSNSTTSNQDSDDNSVAFNLHLNQ